MSQENVEIVRTGYERFAATGKFAAEAATADFAWDMSNFHGWPEQQVYEGVEGAADRRDLVKVILDSRRPVDQLVHLPMKGAMGRSLHDEDRSLFDAVGKLFWTRNQLAHYARRPSTDEATKAVATAVQLFDWLDGL